MLSNEQKALIKRSQREALINDDEYRDILDTELGFGVRSSTDPRLGDRHFDKILAYFEAIYWRKVDAQEIVQKHPKSVFQVRGYWASKNTVQSNSRERHADRALSTEINRLESALRSHGVHESYFHAIQRKTGRSWQYRYALMRTLAARNKKSQLAEQPF
jgi:hypothetical protein